ncbi:ECF transporter S component [uncultured Slackia sp.]|uniref:ECF transporter S component n=1 Tax=uncultured Slackia sp. TaxID=665903 RepID=UPI002600C19A|nr:ECF transporter S component [uncultured Slackia sp.]
MSEQSKTVQFQNTNAWDTRQLVTMALMAAIGALLAFVQIPLIPGVTFLTYDPSFVPAMICGFAFGPGAGVAVGSIGVVIYGLIMGDWVGALMNVIMAVCYVLPAALIYRKFHTFKGAIAGFAVSCVTVLIGALIANLTVGVWFWYGSTDVIMPLLLPAVVPFNLAKAILNSVLTMVIYKAVSNLITPKKNQVKGR